MIAKVTTTVKGMGTAALLGVLISSGFAAAEETKPTDATFKDIVQSVSAADFDLMASTYHPDAVIVSGGKSTKSIDEAMKGWRTSGTKAKADGIDANLQFRFKSRIINATTSYQTGIFRYEQIGKDGQSAVYMTHFATLMVKKGDRWLTLMENQGEPASEAEWNALPMWP
ncbi:hypothetical protein GCM10017044_20880 [Kordiimonas sediminis]|uniref:DUF4440 domain-containing protein n=1 Tax=Kordiimonas sediminis TaxID=1735581 RepID=A0A919AT80_9PROT|nr:nuclear transport factor 2 family protein [Kordiimonas sediminis]GHF25869.1 hypothetical protein GCM10017044_20880 [Kordiimonas sediminis]